MKYKTLEELKKELGDNFDEYMYQTNIELLNKIDKAIEFINENKDKYYKDWSQDDGGYDTYLSEDEIKQLLDILNEVSE